MPMTRAQQVASLWDYIGLSASMIKGGESFTERSQAALAKARAALHQLEEESRQPPDTMVKTILAALRVSEDYWFNGMSEKNIVAFVEENPNHYGSQARLARLAYEAAPPRPLPVNAPPGRRLPPTHLHADGGLYAFERECPGKGAEGEPWIPGVLYRGADGATRWTSQTRWERRFAPVPHGAVQQADLGETMPLHQLGKEEPVGHVAVQAPGLIDGLMASRIDALDPTADHERTVLTDGRPVTADHRDLRPDGMQKGYVVLNDAERAKGFTRPYRESYTHETCGVVTTMGRALAETYAVNPFFYSGTFCAHCRGHFPVGEEGQFKWVEPDGTAGPKVGT